MRIGESMTGAGNNDTVTETVRAQSAVGARKLRICQVVASWQWGGLEKHVVELSNELSSTHEVFVLCHPEMRRHFLPNVRCVDIDFSQSRWSPRLHWQLYQALKRIEPDIVHAQANKAATLVGRVRRLLGTKSKYVATLHNQKHDTTMFAGFDTVIVVSPRLAPLVKASPTVAIFNGIKPQPVVARDRTVLTQAFGFKAENPVFIAVGRLVRAKGFDVLIKAAAQSQVQVLIVGDGELKDDLARQIVDLHAPVVLAGFRSDVPQLMAASDGFVLSSRHEGFAYVFVEALLARLPLVVTDVPMVHDFMPAQLIVPIEDADSLAAKLAWAGKNADAWAALMEPGWLKAQEELRLEVMVARTLSVYEDLLS